MVTDSLSLVDDVLEGVPETVSPLNQWKEAMVPRTWSNGLLEDLFPEGGTLDSADLIVMRYHLMMLTDLRLLEVRSALDAVKDNCPPWVETALIQMASSSDEVARNRDAADIGTLLQVVERALNRPVPMIR